MIHPAWIEFIERLAEIVKNLGAVLLKLAVRLKTEPIEKQEK